jgi:hypothetical protein
MVRWRIQSAPPSCVLAHIEGEEATAHYKEQQNKECFFHEWELLGVDCHGLGLEQLQI